MRDLIRQIVEAYQSPKLEGQEEGVILFSGQEPDTRRAVWIRIPPRLLGENPQIAARFRRLAQAIRQLNHPNITPVQTVGEKAGLPYIVTRAIEKAQSLTEKLDQTWAVDTAADVVMQVGQALEHAYGKGLIHGSLSPQTVVVQEDGRALVTDIGVRELLDLLGVQIKQAATPYLAPERVDGQAVDARADVYSLGAILYRLLAKRSPQVIQGRIVPPSHFNSDVPPAMDEVVVKALAARAEDRYPDVRAFLAALGAVTLIPAVQQARSGAQRRRCPQCGAENQTGQFCRKCGFRLQQLAPSPAPLQAKSRLDEPIQITKIEIGRIEMGKGVELGETSIAQPMQVATGELGNLFPEPLEMPKMDAGDLWPSTGRGPVIAMPEPPPMPVIDWAEIAPPMPEVPTIEDARTGFPDDSL
jgi:serine/threonine protein kinase